MVYRDIYVYIYRVPFKRFYKWINHMNILYNWDMWILYPLVIQHIQHSHGTSPFLIGEPSISMGHLFHGYVSHNQTVYNWDIEIYRVPFISGPYGYTMVHNWDMMIYRPLINHSIHTMYHWDI